MFEYIKSFTFVEDIHEAYYYVLLLIAIDWKYDKRFIVDFYIQHKRVICMTIMKIRNKNNKSWMDLYTLKQYDWLLNMLFNN